MRSNLRKTRCHFSRGTGRHEKPLRYYLCANALYGHIFLRVFWCTNSIIIQNKLKYKQACLLTYEQVGVTLIVLSSKDNTVCYDHFSRGIIRGSPCKLRGYKIEFHALFMCLALVHVEDWITSINLDTSSLV